ncbi:MAG: hypothetical protein ABSH51_16485 [Solirubrobacteraceae bacterium]
MLRRCGLLLLLLSLAVCAWPVAARAVEFGAEVDGDFNYLVRGQWTLGMVETSLAGLRAIGGTVGRSGADWAAAEPVAPVGGHAIYDWHFDDLVVASMAAAGLRWEPMLDYTPIWAQQHVRPIRSPTGIISPLPPASDAVYAAYVTAFARRYGEGGSFWRAHPTLPREPVTTFEIWNEPDCRWTWGPDVDLQDYARLYGAAYRAITRVDSHAIVITGGLAFTRSSLPRLLRALRGQPVDGIGLHPYGPDAQATIALVRWAAAQMDAYGRGSVPLIVNEYGWDAQPDTWQSVPGPTVPGDVERSVVGLAAIRQVGAVIPFEWSDPGWGLTGGAYAAGISQADQVRLRARRLRRALTSRSR